MHEMSLAESIVQLVEDSARREGAPRVRRVLLAIGALSCVEPEALAFCFDAVARGTLAQGAALAIETVAGQGRCRDCGTDVAMTELYGECPACGSLRLQVIRGTEMRVLAIEVDQSAPTNVRR